MRAYGPDLLFEACHYFNTVVECTLILCAGFGDRLGNLITLQYQLLLVLLGEDFLRNQLVFVPLTNIRLQFFEARVGLSPYLVEHEAQGLMLLGDDL